MRWRAPTIRVRPALQLLALFAGVGLMQGALVRLGAAPVLRLREGKPYVTDNGNWILDCRFENGIADPRALEFALARVPGLVESGLFVDLAHVLVVGRRDGTCEVRERPARA